MKTTVLGLGILACALMAGSAQAQCCGAAMASHHSYATPSYSTASYSSASYAAPSYAAPAHSTTAGRARVAYVSKLAQPIQRGDRTLMYAIHLTNGKTLLSHFVPIGHNVQGVENFTPGRLVSATVSADSSGRLMVVDPTTNQPVTTLTPFSGQPSTVAPTNVQPTY